MNAANTVVEDYLKELRAGRGDNAFHGLIEEGPDIIPELIRVYEEV